MASPTLRLLVKSNGSLSVENSVPSPSLTRHKDDVELWGSEWRKERLCAPCPAVHPLLPNSDHHVELTEQWQYYIRAINMGMSLGYVSKLFGPEKAFTNRPKDDLRADWILRRNLNRPNPDQDRVRSCSRAPIAVRTVVNDIAIIETMDGTRPPLMKDGFDYPINVSQINPNAYFYHPKTHPSMFLVATITNSYGRTRPFPNGAVYNWKGDNQPYVFWPYVSNRPIIYPMSSLVRTDKIERPYT